VEGYKEAFDDDPREEQEDPPNAANSIPCDELARELPHRGPETEDIEVLGNQPQDHRRDWSSHVGSYLY
jgi:hypothetical protein